MFGVLANELLSPKARMDRFIYWFYPCNSSGLTSQSRF